MLNISYSLLDKLINIVIGIILGYILYDSFFSVTIRGPNSKYIVDQIYTIDGHKYKLIPKIYN